MNQSSPSVAVDLPAPIHCVNPATREHLGTIPVDAPQAVQAAVARARAAQLEWARTTMKQRRRVLLRVLSRVLEDTDALCEAVVRDTGKTAENALMGEIWPVCAKLRWTIDNGEKHLRPERVSSGILLHKRARLEFHPQGVIGAIIPWNYPLQNIFNPAIPALMSGNAIVIKPSEWVAWSSARFICLLRDALVEEGHDPDLAQLVHGYGETGHALVTSGVDSIVFIGSVENGRRVLEASAQNITPVVLELGGKDPFIVCDDANIEQAAHAALAGCFINAGQNCVASERLLVFDRIYETFARRVTELVDELRQGPNCSGLADVGAMITPLQITRVEKLVEGAVAQGATIISGGRRTCAETGDFYAPTILGDVTEDMEIMNEETFGPVMLLCRVRDEAHAVAVANSTAFGLSASVFSRNRKRARRIAHDVQTGMAAINDFAGLTYMAQDLTFGGVKQSGFGRMNGREGLRACCNVKAVLDDRGPLQLVSKIYPVKPRAYEKARGTIHLLYGSSLGQRVSGLSQVLRNLRS